MISVYLLLDCRRVGSCGIHVSFVHRGMKDNHRRFVIHLLIVSLRDAADNTPVGHQSPFGIMGYQ